MQSFYIRLAKFMLNLIYGQTWYCISLKNAISSREEFLSSDIIYFKKRSSKLWSANIKTFTTEGLLIIVQ